MGAERNQCFLNHRVRTLTGIHTQVLCESRAGSQGPEYTTWDSQTHLGLARHIGVSEFHPSNRE
jgi:hypothetical protein